MTLRRLYLTGLVPAVVALFVLLIAVRTPAPLPGVPTVPPSFDARLAASVTRQLVSDAPDRAPGTAGARKAADDVEQRLRDVASLEPRVRVERDVFQARGAEGTDVEQINVLAVMPGRSSETVVVLARRDAPSPGPFAVDAGASGELVALARALAGIERSRTFVLASVDGSTTEESGARRLTAHLPQGLVPVAAVALAGLGEAKVREVRLRVAGDHLRRTPPSLSAAVIDAVGSGPFDPTPPPIGRQLLDLVAPHHEDGAQAPFLDAGVAAIEIGGAHSTMPTAEVSSTRLGEIGLTLDRLLLTLDQSPRPDGPAPAHILVGERVLAGWMLLVFGLSLLVAPAAVAVSLGLVALGARAPLVPSAIGILRAALPGVLGLAGLWIAGALGLIETDPLHYRLGPPSPVGAATIILVVLGVAVGLAVGRAFRLPTIPREAGGEIPLATAVVALATVLACAVVAFGANPYSVLLLVPAAHGWALLPLFPGAAPPVRVGLVTVPLLAPVIAVLVARGDDVALLAHAIAGGELPGGVALAIAVAVTTMAVLVPVAAGVVAPQRRRAGS